MKSGAPFNTPPVVVRLSLILRIRKKTQSVYETVAVNAELIKSVQMRAGAKFRSLGKEWRGRLFARIKYDLQFLISEKQSFRSTLRSTGLLHSFMGMSRCHDRKGQMFIRHLFLPQSSPLLSHFHLVHIKKVPFSEDQQYFWQSGCALDGFLLFRS